MSLRGTNHSFFELQRFIVNAAAAIGQLSSHEVAARALGDESIREHFLLIQDHGTPARGFDNKASDQPNSRTGAMTRDCSGL